MIEPVLTLWMPGILPRGINSRDGIKRRGRSGDRAAKKAWSEAVLAARSAAGNPRIQFPLVLLWGRLYSGREGEMDWDNLGASMKAPQDWMVRHGTLMDDSPTFVPRAMCFQRRVEKPNRGLVVWGFDARRGAQGARDAAIAWERCALEATEGELVAVVTCRAGVG